MDVGAYIEQEDLALGNTQGKRDAVLIVDADGVRAGMFSVQRMKMQSWLMWI